MQNKCALEQRWQQQVMINATSKELGVLINVSILLCDCRPMLLLITLLLLFILLLLIIFVFLLHTLLHLRLIPLLLILSFLILLLLILILPFLILPRLIIISFSLDILLILNPLPPHRVAQHPSHPHPPATHHLPPPHVGVTHCDCTDGRRTGANRIHASSKTSVLLEFALVLFSVLVQ